MEEIKKGSRKGKDGVGSTIRRSEDNYWSISRKQIGWI
jgi:hypothetical protein